MTITKSLNNLADRLFTAYADLSVRFTLLVWLVGVVVAVGFSLGLLGVKVERSDVNTLWVDLNSRLVDERQQFEDAFGGLTRKLTALVTSQNKGSNEPLFSAGDNSVQSTNAMTALRDTMQIWSDLEFTYQSQQYRTRDVCERLEVPAAMGQGGLQAVLYNSYSQCLATNEFFQILYAGVQARYDHLPATYTPLPPGWHVDRFPCSRAAALDCFREGNEVDWPMALAQADLVSGALTQSLLTTHGQLETQIGAASLPSPFPPVTISQALLGGLIVPCWFATATGNLTCLENSRVDLMNQTAVNTAMLRELGRLTDPAQGVLIQLDRTGALLGGVNLALMDIVTNISMAMSLDESESLALASRTAVLGVFRSVSSLTGNANLGQIVTYFALRDAIAANPLLSSAPVGNECRQSSALGINPSASPQVQAGILAQLDQVVLFFGSIGYWWRPRFQNMTQSQIVEHINLAANAQIDPAVRSDATACITGRARCCQAWNGAFLGTSIYISGRARSQRRPVNNTGFSSLDLESVTLVRSGWEDYHHNNPIWQDLLEARYPSINWQSSDTREAFAKAFDTQLTNRWLRLYNREAGTTFATGEVNSAYRFDFSTGNSLTDILEDASKVEGRLLGISYGVMALLVVLSLGNYVSAILNITKPALAQLAMVNSHGILGLLGLGVIALSSVAGLGFSAICQITFNGLTINLVPFVSLGLGIDDMFVLAHTMYALNDRTKSVAENMRAVMCLAGPSVCLTSVANAVAFILVYTVPVGAIRQLVLVLMISVLINLALLFLIFVPLMVWDMRRNHANRMDVVFVRASRVEKKMAEETNEEAQSLVGAFIEKIYAPLLANIFVKAVVIVLFLVFFAVLLWSAIVNTEQGLRTSDIALRDTYQRDTAELTENIITIQKSNLLIIARNQPFSRASAQQQILDTLSSLEPSPWIVDGTRVHDINFLSNGTTSILGLYSRTQPTGALGLCPPANVTTPISSEQCYNRFYPQWQALTGQFLTPYLYCRNSTQRVSCSNAGATLTIARTNYYFDHLLQHNDYLSAISDVRQRVDPHSDSNVEIFSIGYVFYFWEQYIDIEVTLISVSSNSYLLWRNYSMVQSWCAIFVFCKL